MNRFEMFTHEERELLFQAMIAKPKNLWKTVFGPVGRSSETRAELIREIREAITKPVSSIRDREVERVAKTQPMTEGPQ